MADNRRAFLQRSWDLRHGLAARFTALLLVMALIVAVTGVFGIVKITLVGSSVQQMVRTRAAQEKMAVLMKVAVQESRLHLLEAATCFTSTDFDFAKDDYEMMRDRLRGYVNLLLTGNDKIGIEPAPPGSTLGQKITAVRASWTDFEGAADKMFSRKAELLGATKSAAIASAGQESLCLGNAVDNVVADAIIGPVPGRVEVS